MLHALSSMPKLRDFQLPGITRDGKEWLTMALDPFHDMQVPIRGLPDRANSNTIVECRTEQFTLVAPAGTVGEWCAHIFSAPLLATSTGAIGGSNFQLRPCSKYYGQLNFEAIDRAGVAYASSEFQVGYVSDQLAGSTALPHSLVNIYAWTTNVQTVFPNGDGTFTVPPATAAMGQAGVHMGRVIGAGLEIVNTTADIYKQGSCTVSRTPSHAYMEDATGWLPNGAKFNPYNGAGRVAGIPGTSTYRTQYGPPSSVAVANAFPGTKTWRAADGCYSVLSLDLDDIEFKVPGFNPVSLISTATELVAPTSALTPGTPDCMASVTKQFNDPAGANGQIYGADQNQGYRVSCDNTSIILSGLSPNSSFTVTVRYLIEKAPRYHDVGGSDLVRLASPAAPYDEVALRAYRHVVAQMPVGVPSKYNPLGEYWNHLVSLIQKAGPVVGVIGSVARAIPHPIAQSIANVAQTASTALAAANTAQKISKAASSAIDAAKKKQAAKKKK